MTRETCDARRRPNLEMTTPYCRSCYRTIESSRELCFDCEQRQAAASGPSRMLNVAGIVGIALFFLGALFLNPRFSLAGSILAGAALIVRLVMLFR